MLRSVLHQNNNHFSHSYSKQNPIQFGSSKCEFHANQFQLLLQLQSKCHVSRSERLTGSNQLTTQPHRHKEGERRWVSTSIDRLSREIAVQPDDAHERGRHEEHVLHIWSTYHVLTNRVECFVAEIYSRYSQKFDSAKWRCLGYIIMLFIILLDFSLILVSLLKMLTLKCRILSVKVCKSL